MGKNEKRLDSFVLCAYGNLEDIRWIREVLKFDDKIICVAKKIEGDIYGLYVDPISIERYESKNFIYGEKCRFINLIRKYCRSERVFTPNGYPINYQPLICCQLPDNIRGDESWNMYNVGHSVKRKPDSMPDDIWNYFAYFYYLNFDGNILRYDSSKNSLLLL